MKKKIIMKELSIEEKAKAYDKAIEELKGLLEGVHEEKCDIMEEDIIKIFPELKESEDERIRKSLINYVYCHGDAGDFTKKEFIAWLEKQGKQKPAWSEEDKIALGDALWCCKQAASIAKDENEMGNAWYAERWLKSIKDRVLLQPKQE